MISQVITKRIFRYQFVDSVVGEDCEGRMVLDSILEDLKDLRQGMGFCELAE